MFGRRKHPNELELPPTTENEKAVEVLRVWATPGGPQQVTLRITWKQPAASGSMLVDVARHAAHAYAREGLNADEVLEQIRCTFDAEWTSPTELPEELN